MPIISAKVTERELEAIREFANACGETVSNPIRNLIAHNVRVEQRDRQNAEIKAEYICNMIENSSN